MTRHPRKQEDGWVAHVDIAVKQDGGNGKTVTTLEYFTAI